MTRERALINALEIIETCRIYGNEGRCSQCPYNINGCIVNNGNDIPTEWRAGNVVLIMERSKI